MHRSQECEAFRELICAEVLQHVSDAYDGVPSAMRWLSDYDTGGACLEIFGIDNDAAVQSIRRRRAAGLGMPDDMIRHIAGQV